MKKLRICLEIQGLAENENGEPRPAGLCIELGEVPDEGFKEKYAQLMKSISVEDVLRFIHFDEQFTASDCRFITPEEYDEKYGDE